MEHVLDNPIFNALKTGNNQLSVDAGAVCMYRRNVAPFAGMRDNSAVDMEALTALGPDNNPLVIFTPAKLSISQNWSVLREFEMHQMVYLGQAPVNNAQVEIVDLNESHVPEMLTLTQLTKPGPFLERTIEFGNYTGIFKDGKLVSMTGQRMQPLLYVELSAVCTHPGYLGKGYAGILLQEQIRRVMAVGLIPFLHVLTDNHQAISVYERIGFKTRKLISGYVCNILKDA